MAADSDGACSRDSAAVDDILSESQRLGKMVDQMLTLAQADAGEMPLERSEVAVDELVGQVGRSMKALADARSISLDTHKRKSRGQGGPGAPARALRDPHRQRHQVH